MRSVDKGRGEGGGDRENSRAYYDVTYRVLCERVEQRPRAMPWRSGTHADIEHGQNYARLPGR